METFKIPFTDIDWSAVPKEEHKGETGTSFWQIVQFPGLRIRIVEYSQGYIADHWCKKGHIVHCLEGEFTSELENDKSITMKQGMTYVVSDEMSSHRSVARNNVKLLIIDGDFLKCDL
ncbi:MAG: DHCW motif cupin fold protein [Ignavibacteria bacterium]|nr:DHCW motif cupin fold protein [Ignavibacteria bacterium]